MEFIVVGEDPGQHDGARYRDCQAEDDAGRPAPAQPVKDRGSQHGRGQALHDGSGDSHPSHRQELFEMGLQPDTEHQQDHPDLGELFRQLQVGHYPGRMGADHDSCEEIAHDGGETDPVREVPEDQGSRETAGQGEDQVDIVHVPFSSSRG
ncbi:hypothetical protein DSECCO2_607360 [anaerobic digester metagenome]